MCQRHHNASLLVQQFSDTIYPTAQTFLQQTLVEHGGITAVDAEQQLLSLLIATKEKLEQLIKYDTQLVMPALNNLEKQQQNSTTKVNIAEINCLLKSMTQKLSRLTQQALSLQHQITDHSSFTRSIFDFFFFMEQSFLPNYHERHQFFEEWQQKCSCLQSPQNVPEQK